MGKPWNYGCECRVAQIIARENELSTIAVGRRPWSATSQFARRWLTDDDKAKLNDLAARGIIRPPAPRSNPKGVSSQVVPLAETAEEAEGVVGSAAQTSE